jgi:pimeloyl-ACP methyl ester carboxylesterase
MIGTPGKNYDTPQFRNNMRAYIKRGGDDGGFLRQMAAITGSKNRKELLKSINSPTLIIHGNIDPLIKVKNAVAANKLIKSSELQIIDGMGHLLDEEAYAKFQKSFMAFLREHS